LKNQILKISFLLFIVLPNLVKAQFYSGSDIEFGQNRVQYNSYFWQYHAYQNFKVYYAAGGEIHAEYVAKSAHKFKREIEDMMDYEITDELEFIVYNSQSKFKESNIGLRNDGSSNIGGMTKVVGDKIFIYYEGDHDKLDRQVRSGIAKVIAFKLMFGENWREAIKNTSLLSLPAWYIDGFIAYMEGEWTPEIDNKVKNLILNEKFKSINHLEGEDAILAGLAIWNYIGDVYGQKMIPNVLYMTRISKNIESGFMYVLGTSLPGLSKSFVGYYKGRYEADQKNTSAHLESDIMDIRTRRKYHYYNFSLSPDGNYASFATNELGQYKVWLYDIREDKLKKIAKGGYKLNREIDLTYPIIAWHPTSKVLTFIEEKKGGIQLNIFDVETRKNTPRPVSKLEKVLSMDYNSEGKKLVMSAVNNGQTDIYLYNVIGGNKIQLTNDIFDDLYPSFVDGGSKVIFSSNRLDDTIRRSTEIKSYDPQLDLYILNIEKPTKPLQRLTETPFVNETKAYQYDGRNYTYLSDENGVNNRYIAYYDSVISYIDTAVHYRYFSVNDRLTNYPFGIIDYDVNSKNGSYSMLMKEKGQFKFYKSNTGSDLAIEEQVEYTQFMKEKLKLNNISIASPILENDAGEIDSNKVNINDYQFLDDKRPVVSPEKKEVVQSTLIIAADKKVEAAPEFELPRAKLYELNFASDYIVSQFDNSFLNQTYQRISSSGYTNPGFNGIVKLGLIDIFEDYRIIGGFRYPVNFRNTEYMISYENLKNRLDKKYIATRRSFDERAGFSTTKIQTYEAKYNIKYPFSEVASVRFTVGSRLDRQIRLSTDPGSLFAPNVNQVYGTAKLEYVFDATRSVTTNILNGTRFKAWGEFMHEVTQANTDFMVFGFDFRHYQKIHRSLTFATRVAASTSVGSERLVYFMGGVDNWIGAKFDPSVQISPEQNYQFQTVATPMRGFFQNARNGNTMAVINNELRFPLFQYFAKNPLKSDFFQNFMLIGFGDVGTAWTGWNPYDLENSFNTTIVEGANYEVIIENQKDPIIYGYGGGVRTKILGYYIRYDLAWGVDDGVILDPLHYFSLSLDF
jgi:hypothetical protein